MLHLIPVMYCILQIRQYSDFLVAEVGMPAGSGPAGGDGFNELAGYIFGGNARYTSIVKGREVSVRHM